MTFLLDNDVPEDLVYCLEGLGHKVVRVREVLSPNAPDADVPSQANQNKWGLITCNRDDFLELAKTQPHAGIIILIRRSTRAAERRGVVHLIDSAGENGIANNINFASRRGDGAIVPASVSLTARLSRRSLALRFP